MPKINKDKTFTLKNLQKMPKEIPQNHSQVELVHSDGNQSIKDITLRQWIAVLVLCFVNLINYMDRFTIAGILQEIQDYFGIQDDKGGLLQTVFIVSYMFFGPLFGYLGDRYSRKYIMAAGVFFWGLTTLVGSFMTNFWYFLLFRGLVGIGEASYSTIAPTIISDLFVNKLRSIMLAVFYFAIPVGSGLGYIIGSETAKATGQWQWALRVTPALGFTAVLLMVFLLKVPKRGESEGGTNLESTPYSEDIKYLVKNKSFMLSTAGFTCVAFVAGALSWWGPKFLDMGNKLQHRGTDVDPGSVSFKFGIVAMISGLIGVPAGSYLAQRLRPRYETVDAHICAFSLIVSAPIVFASLVVAKYNVTLCLVCVFFAELILNMTWSLVADILLYVVTPTRRSTAEGFQLLVSHALGDAGSPYLVGVLSDVIKASLNSADQADSSTVSDPEMNDFKALQYALFTTCIVEVLGGIFFLLNALYIVEDKETMEKTIQENRENEMEIEQESPLSTEVESIPS